MKAGALLLLLILCFGVGFASEFQPDSTTWQELINLQDQYIETLENERTVLINRIENLVAGQQSMMAGLSDSLKIHNDRLENLRTALIVARQQLETYRKNRDRELWTDRIVWATGGLLTGMLLFLVLD